MKRGGTSEDETLSKSLGTAERNLRHKAMSEEIQVPNAINHLATTKFAFEKWSGL